MGSFNVTGVHTDAKASGEHRTVAARAARWSPAQILKVKLDVVGLQEANQSTIYKSHLDYGR